MAAAPRLRIAAVALLAAACGGKIAPGTELEAATASAPPVAVFPETRGDGVQLPYPWVGVRGSDLHYTVGSPETLYVRDLGTGDTQQLGDTDFELDDGFLVSPGGLVWATGDGTTWSIAFFDAATRATSVLASGPAGAHPRRLRSYGDTIYNARGDAFEAIATDDRYAYWTQLDDDPDLREASALVRAPKTGGTPCVVDARTSRQLVVDDARITYVTSTGIATRRK